MNLMKFKVQPPPLPSFFRCRFSVCASCSFAVSCPFLPLHVEVTHVGRRAPSARRLPCVARATLLRQAARRAAATARAPTPSGTRSVYNSSKINHSTHPLLFSHSSRRRQAPARARLRPGRARTGTRQRQPAQQRDAEAVGTLVTQRFHSFLFKPQRSAALAAAFAPFQSGLNMDGFTTQGETRHGAFELSVYLRREKLLMAASMSCSSRVSKGFAQAEDNAPTSRSAALLHHKTVTSFSTPGCCISTPNSLPASVSTRHARRATHAAAHPFQSPTRAAPRTSAHAMAPRAAPWPPLRATSNHLNPSAPTLKNLRAKQVT